MIEVKENKYHFLHADSSLVKLEEPVDVVITSPPYNMNKTYDVCDDKLSERDYFTMLLKVFRNMLKHSHHDTNFFVNIGYSNKNPLLPLRLPLYFKKYLNLHLINTIMWTKSITIPGERSFGHFQPLTSERYLNNNFEYIFHFSVNENVKIDKLGNGVPYEDKSNTERFSGNTLRDQGNVWFIPYKTVNKQTEKLTENPCTFPTEIPLRCIRMCKDVKVVIDPFCGGSGATAIASKELKKDCYSIDLSEQYIKDSIKSFQKKNRPEIF